ncbi:MAG: hypothetical protein NT178_17440, partial [Proteobacteria bacterium]|nr:hypothetical protein [Pseudomonadota bacterium]
MKQAFCFVVACIFILLSVSAGVYALDQDEMIKENEAFKKKYTEMIKSKTSKDELAREREAYSKRLREMAAGS